MADRDEAGRRSPDAGPEAEAEGGEAACWLDRVCAGCGRIPDDGAAPERCPFCGAPRDE